MAENNIINNCQRKNKALALIRFLLSTRGHDATESTTESAHLCRGAYVATPARPGKRSVSMQSAIRDLSSPKTDDFVLWPRETVYLESQTKKLKGTVKRGFPCGHLESLVTVFRRGSRNGVDIRFSTKITIRMTATTNEVIIHKLQCIRRQL